MNSGDKKILLQLNVTANWGSTGKIAEGIGLTAMANGWESHIAYGRLMQPSKSSLFKVGQKKDVYLHYAYQRIFDTEGLGSKKPTKDLIKFIRELKPDIIHLHNIHDHWINYEILFEYLNSTDIKIVWTQHDCWAFTGHCFYFESINCERWKEACHNCILLHDHPNALIDNSRKNFIRKKQLFGSNKNVTLVGCSKWIAGFASQSFFTNHRVEVINNGIDLDTFVPTKSERRKKQLLGVASVWEQRKGLDDFIKLASILPEDYEIVLVGLNPRQIEQLPQNIRGIERTQNVNELVELYSQSLALINPTWEDNFPTVNLEALACGTPVITYRTGGSPETIDENTGLVVEKGNIAGLRAAIDTIAVSNDKFTVELCRQRAERFFRREDRFREYISLYNELLKK